MSKDNIYCDECGRTITDNEECFINRDAELFCKTCYAAQFDEEGYRLFWEG